MNVIIRFGIILLISLSLGSVSYANEINVSDLLSGDDLPLEFQIANDSPTSQNYDFIEVIENTTSFPENNASEVPGLENSNENVSSSPAIQDGSDDITPLKAGDSEVQSSTLEMIAGSSVSPGFGLSVKTGASGAFPITNPYWVDVPDTSTNVGLGTGILLEETGDLRLTFTSEARGYIQIRVLVDGKPAHPTEIVLCGPADNWRTYSYTFVLTGVPAGFHTVKVQARNWYTGGTLGDRSLTVLGAPAQGAFICRSIETGSALIKSDNAWSPVPDMSCQITTESGSNLEMTFSAEAYCQNSGEHMFVRALVDGTPVQPSDVLFAYGDQRWVHAFTFTKSGMSAGVHTVQIQWGPEGTGIMFDRTLSVFTAQPLEGLTVVTPASGPDVQTSSGSWTGLPGLTTEILTKYNSDLEVSVCGETYGNRMFLRALLDGATMDPSDVLFVDGSLTGTHRFVFTKQGVVAGSHSLTIQWYSDGGTAYIGDRSLSIISQQRVKPDTLYVPVRGLTSIVGGNDLLILWDPHRPDAPAPAKEYVDSLVFGPKPSVKDYFLQNSQGRFTMNRAGVLGYYDAEHPASWYWCFRDQEDLSEDLNSNCILDPGEDKNGNGIIDGPDGILQPSEDLDHDGFIDYDLNNDGWVSGHTQKWAEAIRKADPEFNYAAYDFDGNKILDPKELTITMVIPQKTGWGSARGVCGAQVDPATHPHHHAIACQPLIVDGVRITAISECYTPANDPGNLELFAEEISHAMMETGDMYVYYFQPFAPGPYSLMSSTRANLDPFHKLRFGWLSPTVVRSDGVYTLGDVETTGQALILERQGDSREEYYLIENRRPEPSYDPIPSAGLAVWHIIEDPSVYDSLPCPAGVDCTQWDASQGWSRKGVRMIRPFYGSQATGSDWRLWDGQYPGTGYNLYSADPDPSHQTLRWADGTPSGFALEDISPAGQTMSFTVRTNLYTYPEIPNPGGHTLSSVATDTNPSTGDWYMAIRGTDNHVYVNKYRKVAGSWSGWTSIGGTTTDEPAAVFTGSYFHVVVRGTDNVLYHKKLNVNSNTWDTGWTTVGGHTLSAPSVINTSGEYSFSGQPADDRFVLAVRGTDNHVYSRKWIDGIGWYNGWDSWGGTTYDRPMLAFTKTATTNSLSFRLTVGVRGTDNKVYTRTEQGGCGGDPPGCSSIRYPFSALGGSTSSPPVIFYADGILNTIVRGTDNHIYYKKGSNSYLSLGGTTYDMPGGYVWLGEPLVELSIRGADSKVYDCTFNTNTGKWTGWSNIGISTISHPSFSRGDVPDGLLTVRGVDNGIYVKLI